ncbi:MAG: class D beta-lactamase [Ignavibacteriaceae bacterium]|nr:class D beta-lactamase [Ignavibacteriaceae bacterium]
MKYIKLTIVIIAASVISLHSQNADNNGFEKSLKEHNAALVIYDRNNNKSTLFDSLRCKKRFLPASTFKIPNALIGLETGVIPDSNYVIKWDGKPKPIKEWERDHTLKSAIYYSVVPYFRELARRVGREKMQYWLNKINYGNNTIGTQEDYFWLDNSLKISAVEQVQFLKKFYYGKLPFSQRSNDIVKNIMPEEDYKNAILKWKTGTGNNEGRYIAWLVGYIEMKTNGKDNIYFFAFNADAETFNDAVENRKLIKIKMLDYLGVTE